MQEIPHDVVIRASEGDIEAFETLYRAAGGYVYAVALRILHNRETAEEVTQDVFLKIYHSLGEFRFRSSVTTWIYRIAVNTALNAFKKMSKELARRVDYDTGTLERTASGQTKEQPRKEENEVLVETLLKRLGPDQRTCVVLRDIEGLSYKEMAQTLKININTVRSRLKRARAALMRAAGERGDRYEMC